MRTEQIKRVAKELIRRFPDRFSKDFENNKRMVDKLVQGATPKVRNQIAGYITHVFAGAQAAFSGEATQEGE
ncbi:MAG: 30S ribosomal protein S17e [Candidatus Bathyarchaeales archaeon]